MSSNATDRKLPRQHERDTQTETVDALIRRAHENLTRSGVTVSPSKVSRVIRRHVRAIGVPSTSRIIDGLFSPSLPSAAETLWYEIATMNNRHVTVPDSYRSLPPISHMHFGQEAMTR